MAKNDCAHRTRMTDYTHTSKHTFFGTSIYLIPLHGLECMYPLHSQVYGRVWLHSVTYSAEESDCTCAVTPQRRECTCAITLDRRVTAQVQSLHGGEWLHRCNHSVEESDCTGAITPWRRVTAQVQSLRGGEWLHRCNHSAEGSDHIFNYSAEGKGLHLGNLFLAYSGPLCSLQLTPAPPTHPTLSHTIPHHPNIFPAYSSPLRPLQPTPAHPTHPTPSQPISSLFRPTQPTPAHSSPSHPSHTIPTNSS